MSDLLSIVSRIVAFAVLLAVPAAALAADNEQPTASFRHDVRPILSNHCFACHGPDEAHREADLRLDVASDVDLQEIVDRITSDDPDVIMPPPDLNKPLKKDQVQVLTEWIDAGAAYQQHWAFVPVDDPSIPNVKSKTWSNQPIDQFVLSRLENLQLQPSSRADKRTLIRRLSLDLTGLPPTRESIHEFLNDESDKAYEHLVDRLLSQAAYGEHMARYWLDLVRFADTNGLHHDHYREMTPYRDWVIRSFNDNVPFDQFITDQLAGDLHIDPTNDQLIASGFNRLHLIIDRGTALPEESAFRNVVDRVAAVGTAFMGLTMQCAVCHDHKYDPITQRDFYQLSAFFNNFDGQPETGSRGTVEFKRGLQPPYLELPSEQQATQLKKLTADLAKLAPKVKAMQKRQVAAKKGFEKLGPAPEPKDDSVDGVLEDVSRTIAQQTLKSLNAAVKRLLQTQRQMQQRRDKLLLEIPATLVMKERADVRPTHIMIRGAYDQPGEEVQRDTPAFLPPMTSDSPQKTRMDLAHWFTSSQNPLTARVTVNRIWQRFFGVGLVRTSEDFGSQGESPSHPKLLDYLAMHFTQSGWNVKNLVRSIVLSETYRQTSHAQPKSFVDDPQNRLLARGSRFRLDAEVVRDQLLSVSGLLHSELYGKSVKPPQPAGLWKIVAMPSSFPSQFKPDSGQDIYRRSVYTFWKRGLPPPQMTVFDAPTRESCIARRERTNTPLQALLLMNEGQHFAAARHFAAQLLSDTTKSGTQQSGTQQSDTQRIVDAYESVTARLPTDQQTKILLGAVNQFRQVYQNDPELTEQMMPSDKQATDDGAEDEKVELAAWTMLVHSLLNLDTTKTRE
ncbi:PSD1 and planctomycete cytochrome C domain-containing protein [Planctomycetes bacterium K23_9]|uniref:Planctomycete cytochrome C n=1 Tax=Stieleria marina TaxID=1930275 RepID=A0A517NZ08_9BACT|nr:Planctomycete cytochrome C [Planctomycetes bacterium K23_9]